jgi:hypothetical protein
MAWFWYNYQLDSYDFPSAEIELLFSAVNPHLTREDACGVEGGAAG